MTGSGKKEHVSLAMPNIKKAAISSLAWKLLERGGNAVVQMAVQVVMARLLAPEEFGALAIMLVFVNLGNVIVQSGLNTALIQAPEADDEDFSTVFWMSLAVSGALYVFIFVLAPAIAAFYAIPELTWPLRALAALFMVNALNSVQVAKVTRDLKMAKVFRSTMVAVVVSAALGIGSALVGAGLWALVIQQLSYQVAGCVVLFFQVDWRPRLVFRSARAKSLFGFSWRLLVSGLLEQGYQSLSDLIVGKQFSAASLGLVSQGKKYPMAVGNMLDGAIQPVMLSAVSRVQGDVARVKRLVRRALKTSTFLIVPAMVAFACCAPSLVPALLGPQWEEAVPFLQVYCLVYALLPVHTTNLQALNGMGRSDLFLRLELVKKAYGVASLLFCAFVLSDVHLLVASYLVTGVISTFVNAWPNKRVIGYSYSEQVCDIAPAFLLSAVSAAPALAVAALGIGAWQTALLQALAFSATYLGLAALLRLEELSYLVSTARDLIAGRRSAS